MAIVAELPDKISNRRAILVLLCQKRLELLKDRLRRRYPGVNPGCSTCFDPGTEGDFRPGARRRGQQESDLGHLSCAERERDSRDRCGQPPYETQLQSL